MVRFAVSVMIFSSSSSYANDSQPIWVCCCLGREELNDMLGGMAIEGGVGGSFGGLIDDYSGDSRGLVFIMNHRHHQHQHQICL
jgi:hypothetical protein